MFFEAIFIGACIHLAFMIRNQKGAERPTIYQDMLKFPLTHPLQANQQDREDATVAEGTHLNGTTGGNLMGQFHPANVNGVKFALIDRHRLDMSSARHPLMREGRGPFTVETNLGTNPLYETRNLRV